MNQEREVEPNEYKEEGGEIYDAEFIRIAFKDNAEDDRRHIAKFSTTYCVTTVQCKVFLHIPACLPKPLLFSMV